MNASPLNAAFDPREVYRLTSQALDGACTAEELTHLEQLLSEHAAARELYYRAIDLHAELAWELAEKNSEFGVEQCGANLKSEIAPSPNPPLAPSPALSKVEGSRSPVLGFLASISRHVPGGEFTVGSLILLVIVAAFWGLSQAILFPRLGGHDLAEESSHPPTVPSSDLAVTVATIRDTAEVEWSAETKSPLAPDKAPKGYPGAGGEGSAITANQPLSIQSGLIELQLKQGTTLLIEGPADWQINGENSATLTHGKLVAKVPPQAIGFTLQTPTARIVDLGTEFGVDVATSQANVTVFVGRIDLHTKFAADRGQPPTVLEAGESARIQTTIDGSEVVSQTTNSAEFKRQIPEKATPPQLTARERLLHDPKLLVHYKFDGPGKDPNRLLNLAKANRGQFDGKINGAKWVEGPKPGTSALAFQTPDDAVQLDVPGEFAALSMAASVYVEPTGNTGHWHGLVMSDRWNRPGQFHWEIARGKVPQVAIQGAADVDCPTALVKEDFGRWLILAVVCDTRDKSVSFYRDGALMDRVPVALKKELVLGPTRIGNWLKEASFNKNDVRNFRGRFEELFIFGRALTTGELARLF